MSQHLTITDDQFDDLVRSVYGAAAEPHLWSDFLKAYIAYTKADAASFVIHDFKNQDASLAVSIGIDPYWQRRYEEYYAGINEWTLRKPHLFQPGAILHGEQAISTKDLSRTEYFCDFLRPNDWLYSYGGVMNRDANVASYISSLRSMSRGRFDDEDAILPRLMPHLQCSLRIHQRIAGMEASLMALTDVLDRIPVGVMILDNTCHQRVINRAAEAILNSGDGISIQSQRIQIASREEDQRFRQRIAAAALIQPSSGSVLLVSRPSAKRPFELMILPLPRGSSLGQGRPAAVVFLTDPENVRQPDTDVLRQVYGLTASEARLASALMCGQSLETYAEEANVTLNTARTHLKRVFSKTGTGRQGELIRLLLSSAAVLRR